METTPPFAPDSAAGNYSAAAKVGGVAGGVILVLILAIIYLILRRGRCSMHCAVGVNEARSPAAERKKSDETHAHTRQQLCK
uniref:Uncharacterized protein n=1 Tax=Salix viminalis TaxID=40686 RepID=A0A6N2LMR4_SALVM